MRGQGRGGGDGRVETIAVEEDMCRLFGGGCVGGQRVLNVLTSLSFASSPLPGQPEI